MPTLYTQNPTTGEQVEAGEWDPRERTFTIYREHEKHRLRNLDLFGIQDDVMQELNALGCETIILWEEDAPGHPGIRRFAIDFDVWYGADVADRNAGLQHYITRSAATRTPVN